MTKMVDDRLVAALPWAGIVAGGPLLPIILLAFSWRERGSLVRTHAKAATIMWAIALTIWLPVFYFGIISTDFSPSAGVVIVAIILTLSTLAISVVGAVKALRA